MKHAHDSTTHPVTVLAMVAVLLWLVTLLGAAGGVLFKWYGSMVLSAFGPPWLQALH